MKKHYFIYLTTNLINGKKYIGRHSTNNLEDGYLGSGTLLKRVVKKYGKENFKREILEHCKDLEESILQEKIWINSNNAERSSDYYNLPIKPIFKESEKCIKVYLEEMDLLFKLKSGSNFKVLLYLFDIVPYNEMEVLLDKKTKTIISEISGIKVQSISDIILKLAKANLIQRTKFRGRYNLNPNCFFKGTDKKRLEMIKKYNND